MTIVVTGLGAISAVGRGCGAVWEALAAGRDGIREVQRFANGELGVVIGGLVPGNEAAGCAYRGLAARYAIDAAREAMAQAGLDAARPPAHRIALVVGVSIGDDLYEPTPLEEITEQVGDALDIRGPRITVSTACTSSTNAIGLALDLLASGAVDLAIAGGTDILTPEIYAGFDAIGVLSKAKCAPFSEPFGTTLGEGAGFLVLESRASAERRGIAPIVGVLGYGLSGDAYHETSPDPSGSGVVRAITGALSHAGVAATEIDYVNAHGTGTETNDPAEWRAFVKAFGARMSQIPVSATKAMLGHAQGAAGVLELIATIEAMRRGMVPQTLHFTRPRAFGPADPVGQVEPRPHVVKRAVKTSAAFGGANAALVIGEGESRARARRPVYVRGLGAVGAHGTELEALWRALGRREALPGAAIAFEELVPTADPRKIDPASRFLTMAVALALRDAGLQLRGKDRDRAGLVTGTTRISPATAQEFRDSIDRNGIARLSAPAFARMVLNAPNGICSKSLGLKGPSSTLDTGDGSGLVALAYAAELLAAHDDADVIAAGGFDEIDRRHSIDGLAEGAACAVLGTQGSIRVAGWGLAGPGRFDEAVAAAQAMAGVTATDGWFGPEAPAGRVHLDPTATLGRAPASAAAYAFVAAVLALRRGEGRSALVAAPGARSVSCAMVLVEDSHGS